MDASPLLDAYSPHYAGVMPEGVQLHLWLHEGSVKGVGGHGEAQGTVDGGKYTGKEGLWMASWYQVGVSSTSIPCPRTIWKPPPPLQRSMFGTGGNGWAPPC